MGFHLRDPGLSFHFRRSTKKIHGKLLDPKKESMGLGRNEITTVVIVAEG
jgi:hypothetical protein